MLQADGGTDNAFGGLWHQVWRRDPWRNAVDRRRRRQRWPLSPGVALRSLLGGCWPAAAQTPLSVALVINFGGSPSSGMLLAGSGTDNEALVTKFGGGLPAGMMWAGGNAESLLGRARACLSSGACNGGHSHLSAGKNSAAGQSTRTGNKGYGRLSLGEQARMERQASKGPSGREPRGVRQ